MSCHDGKFANETGARGSDLEGLEKLSGLVSDLTSRAIAGTRPNLEQIVRDRLGPGVSVEDARAMVARFREIDADVAPDDTRH